MYILKPLIQYWIVIKTSAKPLIKYFGLEKIKSQFIRLLLGGLYDLWRTMLINF